MTDPVEIARAVADVAADTLASNVTLLDISETSSFADVFVICSADNVRQLNALREEIIDELREHGVRTRRVEGEADAGWVLIDYGDVIVHLLTQEQRDFYALELLWSDAPVLLKIQ
jgi:ribosome-associated protein